MARSCSLSASRCYPGTPRSRSSYLCSDCAGGGTTFATIGFLEADRRIRIQGGTTMRDQQEQQQHEIATEEKLPNELLARESPVNSTRTHVEQHDYAYYKQVFAGRPMPFAYLDLDLLEQNIRQVVQRVDDKRVRLASKSLRSVDVIRRILASNPFFRRIICYSPREAVPLSLHP